MGANLSGKCTAEKLGVLHVGPGVVNLLENDIIALHSTPIALSTQEIEEDSKTDTELEVARKCLDSGGWSACKYSSYVHVKDELCSTGLLALRGTRLIILKSRRVQILKLAHEGHQGIAKTKLRLRSKV